MDHQHRRKRSLACRLHQITAHRPGVAWAYLGSSACAIASPPATRALARIRNPPIDAPMAILVVQLKYTLVDHRRVQYFASDSFSIPVMRGAWNSSIRPSGAVASTSIFALVRLAGAEGSSVGL